MSSVCKRATRDTFHHHSRRTFTHFKGFLLCLHRSGNMWKSLVCPLFFFLDNCSRFGESIKNCEQLDIGFVFPRRWKPLPRQSKHKNFTIETKEHSVSLRNEKRTTENRALLATCVDLSRIVASYSDSRNKRHHHNMSKWSLLRLIPWHRAGVLSYDFAHQFPASHVNSLSYWR